MTVVAGVDDSHVSELVVVRAAEQARWRQTDLHLVHVMQIPIAYGEVPIDWVAYSDAHREAIWRSLDAIISEAGVSIERIDLDGYPPDGLVSYAAEQDASLLVVGTRGRGEFASLILGSTSHRAIHLAECDVLVVKAPENE